MVLLFSCPKFRKDVIPMPRQEPQERSPPHNIMWRFRQSWAGRYSPYSAWLPFICQNGICQGCEAQRQPLINHRQTGILHEAE